MRSLYVLLASVLLAWFSTFFFEWWISLLPPATVAALLYQRWMRVFIMSTLPTALLWTLLCLLAMVGGSDLASRVATLFQLPSGALIVLLTVVLGSLLSGVTGLAFHSLVRLMNPGKSSQYRSLVTVSS